jgi:hypothetical protein
MKKKKEPITAAELIAKLANDPEYQRRMQEKEKKWAERRKALYEEEVPLVKDLVETGITVVLNSIPGEEYLGPPRSISDLVNTRSRYPEAIPVLVKHLRLGYSLPIRKSIIRSLITPDSKGNAGILIELFESESDCESELKWLIGLAIAEAAIETDADKIIELANNPIHGNARQNLPLGLTHANKEKALPVLEEWTDDPVLGANAKKTLRHFKKRRN